MYAGIVDCEGDLPPGQCGCSIGHLAWCSDAV